MATKKQELLPEEEALQEAAPQTDVNPELEEMSQPEDSSPDTALPQTDSETSTEGASSEEFRDAEAAEAPVSQIDMETNDGQPPSESAEEISSQTDMESAEDDTSSENASDKTTPQEGSPQTEPEKVKKPRGRRKTKENPSQSDTEADSGEENASDASKRRLSPKESVRLLDRFRRCWPLMTSSASRQMQKKQRTICWTYWSPRKPAAF